ncbi:D-aminoacyl-tRNA deacylase [Trichostrongylus colubriformis]|uniref:D-aminoacyl-tRNA deacylase n=1 Tax=Trichostrongylus colubriformis TaxID=6319 RepID=A0AAN8ET08_TRICO
MRAIIQRVARASVTVGEEVVSSIGRGVCVFVGISRDDKDEDIEYVIRKILNVRLFESENKRWDKSVKDEELEVLCVSQFTLYGYLKVSTVSLANGTPACKM